MRRTDIIAALVARGYKAEAKETIKNGVVFEGIMIRGDDVIAPVIYTEQLIRDAEAKGEKLSDVVAEIIRAYEQSRHTEVSVADLMNPENFLGNVYIGLQKESEESLVKRPTEYSGIESYMYVRGGRDYTMKVTPDYLKYVEIDSEKAWKAAEHNTFLESTIRSLRAVMADMCGVPEEEIPEAGDLFVVTNHSKVKGASAILNKDMLRMFAKRNGVSKLVVLPSSIHEIILVKDEGQFSSKELEDMVIDVNASVVNPKDQLTDTAYHYDSKDHIFEKADKFEQRMTEKAAQKNAEKIATRKSERVSEKDSLRDSLKDKKSKVKQKEAKASDVVKKNRGGEIR